MNKQERTEALIAEMDHVYHVALRLTRDPAAAEDMVQETYLRAMSALTSLRDTAKARVWLFSILRNFFFTHARRERRLRLVQAEAAQEREAAVMDALPPYQVMENSQALEEALAELPPEFRMAVLLCDAEELSYAEIAEAMACPVGTVRSRVARGRAMLAEALRKPMPLTRGREKFNS